MEDKSSEGRLKCTITAQGITLTALYFIDGGLY